MGRYRPASKNGSAYITAEGFERLSSELQALWRKRREVTQALAEAAAEGDRSENAEYIYRKKQLREMDRRIRYLAKRVEELQVVDHLPSDTGRVFFGAWVCLENETGEEVEYRIVGPDEFDPAKRWISMDSPVARALMGKAVDDEVEVEVPGGKAWYAIVAIRYQSEGPMGG